MGVMKEDVLILLKAVLAMTKILALLKTLAQMEDVLERRHLATTEMTALMIRAA